MFDATVGAVGNGLFATEPVSEAVQVDPTITREWTVDDVV